MNILKKLFGKGNRVVPLISVNQSSQPNLTSLILPIPLVPDSSLSVDKVPDVIQQYRESYEGKSLKELNDLYFTILEQLIAADKKGDINLMLIHSKACLRLIEPLIEYTKMENGSFDVKKIPVLDKVLLYSPINNDIEQLKNIQDLVFFFKELNIYKDEVEKAFIKRELTIKIYQLVKERSCCSKAELKKRINFNDEQIYSTTLYYMEKVGLLVKDTHSSKITINQNW